MGNLSPFLLSFVLLSLLAFLAPSATANYIVAWFDTSSATTGAVSVTEYDTNFVVTRTTALDGSRFSCAPPTDADFLGYQAYQTFRTYSYLSTDKTSLLIIGRGVPAGSSSSLTGNYSIAKVDLSTHTATYYAASFGSDWQNINGVLLHEGYFYIHGVGTSVTGLVRVPEASFNPTAPGTAYDSSIVTLTVRGMNVFDNELYISRETSLTSALSLIGRLNPSGIPSPASATGISDIGVPYTVFGQFKMFDLSPAVAGVDTIYVGYLSNGLRKLCYNGTAWVDKGTKRSSLFSRVTVAVDGFVLDDGITVRLVWIEESVFGYTNRVVYLDDTTGFNGVWSSLQEPSFLANVSSDVFHLAVHSYCASSPLVTPTSYDRDPSFQVLGVSSGTLNFDIKIPTAKNRNIDFIGISGTTPSSPSDDSWTQNATFKASFNPECRWSASSYSSSLWTKISGDCTSTLTLANPWNVTTANCPFTLDTSDPLYIGYTGAVYTVITDYMSVDDGLKRTVINETRITGLAWPFRLRFPTDMTVTRNVVISQPTSTGFITYFLVSMAIQSDGTVSAATITIRAYSTAPYSLKDSPIPSILSTNSYVNATTMSVTPDSSCFDGSGTAVTNTACLQDIRILLQPVAGWDTTGECQYDGNYTLTFDLNCRTLNFNRTCPSPLTSTVSLLVDTASACPRIDYNLPFNTSLTTKDKNNAVLSVFRFTDNIKFEVSISWPALIGVSVSGLSVTDFKVDLGAGYESRLSMVVSPSVSITSSSATISWIAPASQLNALGNNTYVATIQISYSGLSKRTTVELTQRALPSGTQLVDPLHSLIILPNESESGGSNTPEIVGITVGVAALFCCGALGALAALAFFIVRRNEKTTRTARSEDL